MIFKKIISDKKGILNQKLITIILVILVVVISITFIFKSNAFGFLENFLPDLSVGEDNYIAGEENNDIIVESEVSETQLAELMKYYSTNTITNFDNTKKNCDCGTECDDYAKWTLNYAKVNGVEPILILALMMQESNCNKNASSGSSYGLMQINAGVWCGEYGLPKDMGDCEKKLLEDEELNINVGVKILKGYYNDYGLDLVRQTYVSKVKKYCTTSSYQEKYLSYTDWNSTLRAYNGFGCGEKSADVNYVENVNTLYIKLKQNIK